jgi:hypothetical protein
MHQRAESQTTAHLGKEFGAVFCCLSTFVSGSFSVYWMSLSPPSDDHEPKSRGQKRKERSDDSDDEEFVSRQAKRKRRARKKAKTASKSDEEGDENNGTGDGDGKEAKKEVVEIGDAEIAKLVTDIRARGRPPTWDDVVAAFPAPTSSSIDVKWLLDLDCRDFDEAEPTSDADAELGDDEPGNKVHDGFVPLLRQLFPFILAFKTKMTQGVPQAAGISERAVILTVMLELVQAHSNLRLIHFQFGERTVKLGSRWFNISTSMQTSAFVAKKNVAPFGIEQGLASDVSSGVGELSFFDAQSELRDAKFAPSDFAPVQKLLSALQYLFEHNDVEGACLSADSSC